MNSDFWRFQQFYTSEMDKNPISEALKWPKL